MLSFASDKLKLFAENFSMNSSLDDSGISLPVFPSRTNLKLHNISVTPKMVKKVITAMTFLMLLSLILISMLMILLSILSGIRHLICGNNFDWLLNINLIYKTLWTGARSALLISMLEKLNWFCLTSLMMMLLM